MFDNSKTLGHCHQKWFIVTILLEHYDYAVGAMRLGLRHSDYKYNGYSIILLYTDCHRRQR